MELSVFHTLVNGQIELCVPKALSIKVTCKVIERFVFFFLKKQIER